MRVLASCGEVKFAKACVYCASTSGCRQQANQQGTEAPPVADLAISAEPSPEKNAPSGVESVADRPGFRAQGHPSSSKKQTKQAGSYKNSDMGASLAHGSTKNQASAEGAHQAAQQELIATIAA